jgi:hypothetical protein
MLLTLLDLLAFRLIGSGRAFCLLRLGGEHHMQATTAYMGSEQPLDIPADIREAQEVFSRCLPVLHRTAYRYLGNPADAEDAVQDAFLSAYKHLDQLRGRARLSRG